MTEINGKPLQTIAWASKLKNKKQWFKDNADYWIRAAFTNDLSYQNYDLLYGAYNSQFPAAWFSHITDPLSAKKPAHKAFPAKLRPVNILRTNLDQLMSEYRLRPFIYTVVNLGDEAYNEYTEGLTKQIQARLLERFAQKLQQELEGSDEELPDDPTPQAIKDEYHASYKDAQAIKGQKWLKRALREFEIRQKFSRLFKDWVIVGDIASYKGIEKGNFFYEHLYPDQIRAIMSPGKEFYEDADVVVARRDMSVSDIVERFYEDLTKEDIDGLERRAMSHSPEHFYSALSKYAKDGFVPVWHVCWTGKKKVKMLYYTDPTTGVEESLAVDEDYPVAEGERVEILWINEIYETWRIHDDLYLRMRPLENQRSQMNNFSATKQPYNGRRYSDVRSENLSVLKLGLPYQIMVIIINYTLERTIAKSKGKIAILDKNTIPREGDWDEEKFFYYSEALGYALINRNQVGVDKSFNQYTVLDLSLYDQIKQLIELQDYYIQKWDDVIGFNRQRKGQTYASDLVGVTERAAFQSTLITDMIFTLFEEFTQRELQGILDYSKFLNADGVRKLWNDDVFRTELIEIDPIKYANAELGIFVESSAEAIALKNKMEANVQAMLQNEVRPSTIAALYKTQSIAEIEVMLKKVEAIQDELGAQQAQSEEEAAKAADDRKKAFMELENKLKLQFMHEEYDRKEDIAIIQGEFNTFTFQDGDSNDNGIPDATEVEKLRLEREKLAAQERKDDKDRESKERINDKTLETKERTEKIKAQAAAKRAARSKKS